MTWEEFENAAHSCRACGLCAGRNSVVIGKGNRKATVLFVGEGPGEQEDIQGLPFVGPAGQLFDLALDASGIDKNDIYIANVVKCRPPQNRNPFDEECTACLPYLRAQFSLIRPKIVVCMGKVAAKALLHHDEPMNKIRGRWENVKGTFFMTTYHPAALLRDERLKLPFFNDLTAVKTVLGELKENGEAGTDM